MIYVPDLDYQCFVVQDMNTIRAYKVKPYNPVYNQNVQLTYTDYYVNSHYMSKNGTQNFNYNTTLPTCIDSALVTNDFYYRNDISDILITFLIFLFIGFVMPFKIITRFFKRFR